MWGRSTPENLGVTQQEPQGSQELNSVLVWGVPVRGSTDRLALFYPGEMAASDPDLTETYRAATDQPGDSFT